jgi:predicted  nucleic acid-binding Zn-ribbon protein
MVTTTEYGLLKTVNSVYAVAQRQYNAYQDEIDGLEREIADQRKAMANLQGRIAADTCNKAGLDAYVARVRDAQPSRQAAA